MKKQNGITLITLVVTIIVLIVMAGVSINLVLGENGIVTKTKQAAEETKVATEKEKIQLIMLENIMENKQSIGKRLYDKKMENGNKWNIIIAKKNNQVYGSGYNFIEKGIEISGYGNTKYNYLINETTGEVIELNDGEYVELSFDSSIGVTDNLIFNLDSSIIENENSSNIEEKLGEDVELVNFDWNEESGLTTTSFNLDGVNDYIKVKYDNEEEKQILAQSGFTFEFYGVLNGGTSYKDNNEILQDNYKGLFCYWNGNESQQAKLRFGTTGDQNTRIYWNAGQSNFVSDYSNGTYPWNIFYPVLDELEKGKEVYITITLDTSNSYIKDNEEYYTHTVYANGVKKFHGGYNKKSWDNFIKENLNSLKYFCIGRSSQGQNGWWHYSKMNAFALRLYNKALTEQEVQKNYDKSVQYHNLLINNN